MKIDSSAQYCWENHKDNHCKADSENDWKTQHAVCSSNECMLRLIHRDSAESANQSSSWNLMKQKSHDFTAVFEHHKSLWSHDTQQNDACVMNQKNIKTADRMSTSIYDRQNLDFNAVRYWNKRKINIC